MTQHSQICWDLELWIDATSTSNKPGECPCLPALKPDSAFATVLLLYIIVPSKWINYCHLADRMNLELEHLAFDDVMGLCLKKLPSCGTAVVIFYSLVLYLLITCGVVNGKYLYHLSLISSLYTSPMLTNDNIIYQPYEHRLIKVIHLSHLITAEECNHK